MALDEHDPLMREIQLATRDLQVEVSHLVHAVEENGRQIEGLGKNVAELAQAQRRTEKQMEKGFADMRRDMRERDATHAKEQAEQAALWRREMKEMFAEWDERNAREQAERDAKWKAELAEQDAKWKAEQAEQDTKWKAEQAERDERIDRNFRALRQEIGALTAAFADDLDEIGRDIAAIYLKSELGWEVAELQPGYLRVGKDEFEIDFLGEARKGDEVRRVAGEAKSRVDLREVEELVRKIRRIEAETGERFLWVLFPRKIFRRALDAAREVGIVVVPWDYQYRRRVPA